MSGAVGGRLTTHVLDTMAGRPGAGLKIDCLEIGASGPVHLKTLTTNADGRCDAPVLAGADLRAGVYELHFHAGDYFRARGVSLPDPPFLDVIPVRFGVGDTNAHYHVPLLVSPYAYSTYRGS